ncbi:MAG: glycosyltransferase [Bacteroidetes bacterium]|nr:glycosyltransferase [Bacteroidota bacterium]
MKVLISGLPLFSKRLAEELQKYDPESKYIFLDTYNSKCDQIKFFLQIPFSDVVISMNGVTDNSGSLNLVLKWKKKLILQWMGTDASLAMERFKNKTMERKYIDYACNFVDSEWLMKEVKSIDLKPEYLHFKSVIVKPNPTVYKRISVMSYVAENRQAFYGMERIAELAKAFPEVDFQLFGLTKSDFPITSNVHLNGWVSADEFENRLRETPIFLRLTEHDGFSVSVIEALGAGCEVMMSLPFELTYLARNTNEAIEGMKQLINRIERRGMKTNEEMMELVKDRYNPEALATNYIQKIKEIVKQ